MERETRKFKTVGGNLIEVKTYITGKESRDISAIYLEGIKVGVDVEGKPSMPSVEMKNASRVQDKAIETIVVSFNGVKENILDSILDLPKIEFDEVVAELDKIQNPISEQKKTK